MYTLKCKILKLDSIVTFKRFYNPPTKKTWSKQNPLFKTARPLVEPYNLGRLHPEKEWWNLTKKGLKPDTYMGFPDVENISKHGGSLYAHFMDGSTLSMVVYRCIEKNINDIDIWSKLTAQALKLSMSLDAYLISILFLYFSLSSHYDYRFVATYIGRILATLDQFGLEECSNVILAMSRPQFYHEKAFKYVIRHCENLCLIGNLKVEECLRFLSCLKNVEDPPQNCLIPIGQLIEVSDLSIVDRNLIFDALDACCTLNNKVGPLFVTKLIQESCDILESLKEFNHYFSLVFLNAVETYKFKNDRLLHLTIERINENIHDSVFEEQCRYIYLLSKLFISMSKNYSPLAVSNLRGSVLKMISVFKKEVMKRFDELGKDEKLSFQVAIGLINSNEDLNQDEIKLIEGVVHELHKLTRHQLLELYTSLSNTRISTEYVNHVKETVAKACWSLESLNVQHLSVLLGFSDFKYLNSVPKERMDECFNILFDEIPNLNSHQMLMLIRFASRDIDTANQLLIKLVDHKKCLYNANIIVELINLYKTCNKEPDEFIYELLDGLCERRVHLMSDERLRLIDALKENHIKHHSIEKL